MVCRRSIAYSEDFASGSESIVESVNDSESVVVDYDAASEEDRVVSIVCHSWIRSNSVVSSRYASALDSMSQDSFESLVMRCVVMKGRDIAWEDGGSG